MARLRFLRLFWRAPRMTIASPETCSCFKPPFYASAGAFYGAARGALAVRSAENLDVADQRAAAGAMHRAAGVKLEPVGVAGKAEIARRVRRLRVAARSLRSEERRVGQGCRSRE